LSPERKGCSAFFIWGTSRKYVVFQVCKQNIGVLEFSLDAAQLNKRKKKEIKMTESMFSLVWNFSLVSQM